MADLPFFIVAGCFGAEANLVAMASTNNVLPPDPVFPLPSTPPAALHLDGEEVHAVCGCWAGSAPSSPLLFSNNPIDSVPDNQIIQKNSLSCWWPNIRISRSGDWFAGFWTSPAMEELGEATGQTPLFLDKDFSMPDQSCAMQGSHCDGAKQFSNLGIFQSLAFSNMVSCSFPLFPVASSKDLGALRIQSLLVSPKSGGMKSDGCCVSSELDVCCLFVAVTSSWKNSDLSHVMSEAYSPMVLGSFFPEILDVQLWTLRLGSRGVMCVAFRCFFCMLETRMIDDLADDGGYCLFGSIHRWQMRAPLLLISGSMSKKVAD